MNTLLWYDYETFGIDPRHDRIAQFAAQRTDEALQPVGDPVSCYCRLADDYLPQPGACLVTGITPRRVAREGLGEAEFARVVHAEMARPRTCTVGYNSIRFDDEFTRFLLYRNFYDPYAREWRQGNSRWDLLDVLRLARALRPQGLQWPEREDGTPSFRLEDLSAANGIEHAHAHDALADVNATLDLARRLRRHQPRLFDYVLRQRDKRRLAALLDPADPRPVLHVSGRYPARLGCIALVLPLARHAANRNEIIVYDLRRDPTAWLALSPEEIAARVFGGADEIDDGERIALKTVRLNRAPVVVPAGTLTDEAAAAWQIDPRLCRQHAALLAGSGEALREKLAQVFAPPPPAPDTDPEAALYSGGFIDEHDASLLRPLQEAAGVPVGDLDALQARLHDARLPELLFRWRARNLPDTLDEGQRRRWQAHRRGRLRDGAQGALTLAQFRADLAALQARENLPAGAGAVLGELHEFADQTEASLDTD